MDLWTACFNERKLKKGRKSNTPGEIRTLIGRLAPQLLCYNHSLRSLIGNLEEYLAALVGAGPQGVVLRSFVSNLGYPNLRNSLPEYPPVVFLSSDFSDGPGACTIKLDLKETFIIQYYEGFFLNQGENLLTVMKMFPQSNALGENRSVNFSYSEKGNQKAVL